MSASRVSSGVLAASQHLPGDGLRPFLGQPLASNHDGRSVAIHLLDLYLRPEGRWEPALGDQVFQSGDGYDAGVVGVLGDALFDPLAEERGYPQVSLVREDACRVERRGREANGDTDHGFGDARGVELGAFEVRRCIRAVVVAAQVLSGQFVHQYLPLPARQRAVTRIVTPQTLGTTRRGSAACPDRAGARRRAREATRHRTGRSG